MNDSKKFYIRLFDTSFKERYRNHTKDFRNQHYEKSTELSKYIWRLKNKGSRVYHSRHVTRDGRRGGGLLYPFSKIEKSALILGKHALIVIICGLNFSFKIQYLRVCRRNIRGVFLAGPFFLVLYVIVDQSALIPRKLPCSKKIPGYAPAFNGKF